MHCSMLVGTQTRVCVACAVARASVRRVTAMGATTRRMSTTLSSATPVIVLAGVQCAKEWAGNRWRQIVCEQVAA
jgi:hypothetical protein